MRLLKTIVFLFACHICQVSYGQAEAPMIKGEVNISIKKGTVECHFFLSQLPDISNYVIRINSGMNIRSFKDTKYGIPLYYDIDNKDTLAFGETIAYYLHENIGNPGRYLPKEIEFKYGGMYPVVPDSASGYQAQDWRGNMAFNGYSLRVDGHQAAWYPVLFDMKKQKIYEKVRYDVKVNCSDCDVLFVNGNAPVKARSATFSTDIPHEMLLYCGNFEVENEGNTWLLNSDMTKDQNKQFMEMIKAYKTFFEKKLDITYKGNTTYIQTTPVASPDHAFSFVASPTILNVGIGKYGLSGMFNAAYADRRKKVIAHELGHYYFGTVLRTNSEFGAVINEGFTEYIAFKLVKEILGSKAYDDAVKEKLRSVKYLNGLPFARIKTEKDFSNRQTYVYDYVPILLIAVEKELGEKAMWDWLKVMLNEKTDFTDYAFLERTFDIAIKDKGVAERIKEKYFRSDKSVANVVSELGGK